MENAVGAGRDGLVAEHAAGKQRADGRLLAFHCAHLHRRGVRAQQNVRIVVDEKRILHVASRMFGREIERRKDVPIVLNFRTFGNSETQTAENLDNVVADYRERMAAAPNRRGGLARKVDAGGTGVGCRKRFFEVVDFCLCNGFQFVELFADFAFLLVGNILEIVEKSRNRTFFTKVFYSQRFDLFGCRGRGGTYFFGESLNFI